jgi:hypothetical protein
MIIGKRVMAEYGTTKFTGILVVIGVGFEELSQGVAQFTEAFVMLDDGEIKSCLLNCIRVLNPQG